MANASTGRPREAAHRAANNEPRELGEAKNTTKPDEAAATTARVREARRMDKGAEESPPDHQETEPPAR
ncbi:hypothetical protein Nwat_3145 (plasmid) [Nitrosococcus watsonii C-113]|uniref:Uncharacterized protein n=1 Tax=Nitrosococcus watsoni (strain C-113) TaxID=105559 RepID=D8KCC1_NITWC|nr:hypothetical protein Nwat_3145 [Nitrosococcus watsonii C-113]